MNPPLDEPRGGVSRRGVLRAGSAAIVGLLGVGTKPGLARSATTETVSIEVPNLYHAVTPEHTRGDREFDGNGPDVVIYAYVHVKNDNELWSSVYMSATETESDWTTGEAFDSRKLWDGDDFGAREIVSVDSDTFTYDRYTDTDHARDVLGQPRGELVDQFKCVGDTAGDDVESGTRFTSGAVFYNPVSLTIRQPRGPVTKQISPRPLYFTPEHTRGDREFDGNGPEVDVYAWLDVRDDNELWGTVQMFAEETEPDWTTAFGRASRRLWDGDDARVDEIVSVDSDTFSYGRYTDTDHGFDVVDQPSSELVDRFVCVGDTAGDEAGTRTRVKVYFDPVELSVRY